MDNVEKDERKGEKMSRTRFQGKRRMKRRMVKNRKKGEKKRKRILEFTMKSKIG